MKDRPVLPEQPTATGIAACLLLTAAVGLLQVSSSAYSSEFGAFPDEAAHVVTGLMAHDFLWSGQYGSPMSYAESYYLHYPKVAIGHWPPGFYGIQLLSNGLFGGLLGFDSQAPLLLMALLGSILACLTFWLARAVLRRAGPEQDVVSPGLGWALILSGVMITSTLHQQSVYAVMTELPMALLSLGAALAYGLYLKQSQDGSAYRAALLFALFASCAIMTKGSGLLLGLLPPGCVLLSHRLKLLKRLDFWLPAVVVALLCAPFYLLTLDMQRNGMMHESPSLGFLFEAVPFYFLRSVFAFGPAIVLFALLGAAALLTSWKAHQAADPEQTPAASTAPDSTLLALLVLILSVVVFHSAVPAGLEERHLMPAFAPAIVLAALGIRTIVPRLARLVGSSRMAASLCATVILVPAVLTFDLEHKHWRGFEQARQALDSTSPWKVLLVSSDPQGEGMMIADVALADGRRHAALADDTRPERYALRASKLLASDRWSGADYVPLFESTSELFEYLSAIPVEYLVIDDSMPADEVLPHHRLLGEMAESEPTVEFLGSHPLTRDGVVHQQALRIFRLADVDTSGEPNVEVDLGAMLGRSIGSTE